MKIDFTYEQLGILDKAIQQLPYYIAAPLIDHINKEVAKEQEIMDTPIPEKNMYFKTHQQNGE